MFPFDSKTFSNGSGLELHLYLSHNMSPGYTGTILLLDCDTFHLIHLLYTVSIYNDMTYT